MGSAPTLATAAAELADDIDEYAEYIRQITGDGEAIVDCLIRIMEDDSVGAKPYERLDAQLLLDSIGFGRLAVDQASIITPAGAVPASTPMPAAPNSPRTANAGTPRRPVITLSEETLFRLPTLVRQKTDKGRKMADFLTAVVRGEMNDFRPHHWIRAAKHLAARAYSREVDPGRPGLSLQDAMKLIDKLFPGFKPYHRVDLKALIRRGFDDATDDDRPSSEAARARREAGVRAEAERRRLDDEEEEECREKEGGPATGSAGVSPASCSPPERHQGIPDPPDDYESRPGRRIGLSKWERKAIEKGIDLGWDCGIPP